jgi:hypothetical protein
VANVVFVAWNFATWPLPLATWIAVGKSLSTAILPSAVGKEGESGSELQM